jgi:predicted RNA-binding protein
MPQKIPFVVLKLNHPLIVVGVLVIKLFPMIAAHRNLHKYGAKFVGIIARHLPESNLQR